MKNKNKNSKKKIKKEKDNFGKDIYHTPDKELIASIYHEISNQWRINNPKEYKWAVKKNSNGKT